MLHKDKIIDGNYVTANEPIADKPISILENTFQVK
jgi:hypothetical protein